MAIRLKRRIRIDIDGAASIAGRLFGPRLPVPYFRQGADNWCWAATTVMVSRYFGNQRIEQCDLANWLLGYNICCATTTPDPCDRPCQMSDVQRLFRALDYNCESPIEGHVSISALQFEIARGRPIEIAFQWSSTRRGHVALVCGVGENGMIDVLDPWYGQVQVRYENLVAAYGRGVWLATWRGISR